MICSGCAMVSRDNAVVYSACDKSRDGAVICSDCAVMSRDGAVVCSVCDESG